MSWSQAKERLMMKAGALRKRLSDLHEEARREAPSENEYWLAVAEIEEEVGRIVEAVRATRRWLMLCTDAALPPINHLGHLLARLGLHGRAAACAYRTASLEPKGHRWTMFAISVMRSGRREEAIRAIEQAIECEPDFDEAHLNLGLWLMDEDPERARACIERALELDPEWAANYSGAASFALKSGDYGEAMRLAEEGLRLDPAELGCRRALALALDFLGRTEQAEREFREAVRQRPTDVVARGDLAAFLANHERMDEAKRELTAMLRAWPDTDLPYSLYLRYLEGKEDLELDIDYVRESRQVVEDLLDTTREYGGSP